MDKQRYYHNSDYLEVVDENFFDISHFKKTRFNIMRIIPIGWW